MSERGFKVGDRVGSVYDAQASGVVFALEAATVTPKSPVWPGFVDGVSVGELLTVQVAGLWYAWREGPAPSLGARVELYVDAQGWGCARYAPAPPVLSRPAPAGEPAQLAGFYETQSDFERALHGEIAKAAVSLADARWMRQADRAAAAERKIAELCADPSYQAPDTYVPGRCALVPMGPPPEPAPRTHNAVCSRCWGPAYVGLGLPRCEREGGCLADREPTEHEVQRAPAHERVLGEPVWISKHPEGWQGPHATRDLAVAAWREALLARAKREAGL